MSVLSIEFMAFLSAVEASGLVVNPIVAEEGTDESIDELRGDGDELEEEFHVGTLSKSGMDCACSTASSIALFLSLIHISEPTRRHHVSRMPSSA